MLDPFCPDGGLFVPLNDPELSPRELERILRLPSGECMAQVLNLLLDTRLTGADVELCLGKRQIRATDLGQKAYRLECWHNPQGNVSSVAAGLIQFLFKEERAPAPGGWAYIVTQISALFAAVGAFTKAGIAGAERKVDVSAVAGDLSGVMSAWYARKWGLPIGTIICGCNENSGLWELLHHGQIRTDGVAVHTASPDADVVVPVGMERLIYSCGGQASVESFLNCICAGKTYAPENSFLEELRRGLYVGVVSGPRVRMTAAGVYRNCGCVLSAYDAIAYASVQDYRAQGGNGGPCLLLSTQRPGR